MVWRRHRLQLADDQQRDILRPRKDFLFNYLSYQCEDNWCWCGSYQLRCRLCYCRAHGTNVSLKLHTTYFEKNAIQGVFLFISNIVANADRQIKSKLIIGTHGVQYFTLPEFQAKKIHHKSVCFGTFFQMNLQKSSKGGWGGVIFNQKVILQI